MPYHLSSDHADCSGWAVVKDGTDEVMGCHATEDDAKAQLAALYANEPMMHSRPPRDMLVRLQPGDFELRELADATPTLVGHFAVFNQWTEVNSVVEGHFMERILPGAFARTMTNNRDRMRVTFNHGKDPTLGDQVLGVPSTLEEDDVGARYEVPLFNGIPPLLLDGLRHNAYGSSFRFRVVQDDYVDKPKKSATNPNGLRERSIIEAQVFEFGPVTYPAYPGATAGIRSTTDDYLLAILRDALPHDGPEAEPHSDEGTRVEIAEPAPPPVKRRHVSDEEWLAFLASEETA